MTHRVLMHPGKPGRDLVQQSWKNKWHIYRQLVQCPFTGADVTRRLPALFRSCSACSPTALITLIQHDNGCSVVAYIYNSECVSKLHQTGLSSPLSPQLLKCCCYCFVSGVEYPSPAEHNHVHSQWSIPAAWRSHQRCHTHRCVALLSQEVRWRKSHLNL